MAHQAAKNPHVSVLLAVRDADAVLARTVESVLSQGYRDFELVAVDCASTDGTLRKLQRHAEHDIRVEVVRLDAEAIDAGRDAALAAARGDYALFMDQGDWLAPGYLEGMVAAADERDAELVFSALSLDTLHADGGRSAVAIEPAPQAWDTKDSFHRGLALLLGDRILTSATGKLLDRRRAQELFPKLSFTGGALDLALAYLDGVGRACVLQEPCYHVACGSAMLGTFDPALYRRVEEMQGGLLRYFDRWSLTQDAACMEALHRLHLMQVIRCIENVCLSSGRLSSIERRRRVQDMIDAPAVQASIEALRASSKDFGLMFAPIARRSAAACCMGARIQDIVSRTLAPFSPARAALR